MQSHGGTFIILRCISPRDVKSQLRFRAGSRPERELDLQC